MGLTDIVSQLHATSDRPEKDFYNQFISVSIIAVKLDITEIPQSSKWSQEFQVVLFLLE